jgi:ATP-dependent protease ClpP protease subunit
MYHKPQAGINSDAGGFRSLADRLDQIENENILKNLSVRTGKESNELASLIANEWWLTSDESIQILGFLPLEKDAIINRAQTKQFTVYKNYIERKKALANNAFSIYINHKNNLK